MTAHVVIGLGYGDEGKGSVVDWLVREHGATQVVRFNGGAQAAHNVVTPEGYHHTFAQWGSGTFIPGVRTVLSSKTLVNPLNMLAEEAHLQSVGVMDAWERLTIDSRALVITPWHRALNRVREMSRGDGCHGSCGEGIGETVADMLDGHALRAGDLVGSRGKLERTLREFQERLCAKATALMEPLSSDEGESFWAMVELHDKEGPEYVAGFFQDTMSKVTVCEVNTYDPRVVFEGAQGVLLDEDLGTHPHTTWSRTTFSNAEGLLGSREFEKVGVTRAYATRHGAGPLFNEDPILTEHVQENGEHNKAGRWQGDFRCGWADIGQMEYVRYVLGPLDKLVVSCVDHLGDYWPMVGGSGLRPKAREDALDLFQETLRGRELFVSDGPTAEDKRLVKQRSHV